MYGVMNHDNKGQTQFNNSNARRFQFERMDSIQQEAWMKKQRDQMELRRGLELQVEERKLRQGKNDDVAQSPTKTRPEFFSPKHALDSGRKNSARRNANRHVHSDEDYGNAEHIEETISELHLDNETHNHDLTHDSNPLAPSTGVRRGNAFEWQQDDRQRKRLEMERQRKLLDEQMKASQKAKETVPRTRSSRKPVEEDDWYEPMPEATKGTEFDWKQQARLDKKMAIEKQKRLLDEQMQTSGMAKINTSSPRIRTPPSPVRPDQPQSPARSRKMKSLGSSNTWMVHNPNENASEGFEWKLEARARKQREIEEQRRLLDEQLKNKPKPPPKKDSDDDDSWPFSNAKTETKPSPNAWNQKSESPDRLGDSPGFNNRNGGAFGTPRAEPQVVSMVETHQENDPLYAEELQFLRREVAEQKVMLQQQALKMNELLQVSMTKNHEPEPEPIADQKVTRGTSKAGPGDGKAANAKGKPQGKQQGKRSLQTTGKATLSNIPERGVTSGPCLRECELRRDAAGKLHISIDTIMDRCCVIKSIGKSFAKDERKRLKTGDVIVAIGAFAVRQAMQDNVESVQQAIKHGLPDVKQVVKAFKSGPVLVKVAVFPSSVDEITRLLVQEDRIERGLPPPVIEEENLASSNRLDSPGNQSLRATSDFIYSNQWAEVLTA